MTDVSADTRSAGRQRTPIEYKPPPGQPRSHKQPRVAWPEDPYTVKLPTLQLPYGQHRFKQGTSGANGNSSARPLELDGPEPGEVVGSIRHTTNGGIGGGLAAAYRAQKFGHPHAATVRAAPLQNGRSSMTWSRDQSLAQQQRQPPSQPLPSQPQLQRPQQQRQVPSPAESELAFASNIPNVQQRRPVQQAAALMPVYSSQMSAPAEPALTRPQRTQFGAGWDTADHALEAFGKGDSKLALTYAGIVPAMPDGERQLAEKGFRKRWAQTDVVRQRLHDPAVAAELDMLLAAALGLEDEPLPRARSSSGSPHGGGGGGSPFGISFPNTNRAVAAHSFSGEEGGSGRVVEMPRHGSGDGKHKRTVTCGDPPTKLSKQQHWQDKKAAADGWKQQQHQQQHQHQHNGAAAQHSNKTMPGKLAPKMAPKQAAPVKRPQPKPAVPTLDQKLSMSLDALAGGKSPSKQQQKKPQQPQQHQAGHQANEKASGGATQPSGKHTPIMFKA